MYKYSVILGNLGNTCDRFCKGYKDNPSTEEMLARAAKIPFVEGIELVGTWDIRPDNVTEMKKRLEDYGIKCVSIIPDVFTMKGTWERHTHQHRSGHPDNRRWITCAR